MTTTTLQQQIREADQSFAEAFNSGDLDAITTYHEDGFWMVPPGAPAVRAGSNDAAEAIRGMYEAGFRNMRQESVEFASDGDLAYHLGRTLADMPVEGGVQTLAWSFLDIYKRDDAGHWKIHVSIWNDDSEA